MENPLLPLPTLTNVMEGFPAPFFLLDGEQQTRHRNAAAHKVVTDWGEKLAPALLEVLCHSLGESRWEELREARSGFSAREAILLPPGAALGRRFTCTGHWFDPAGGVVGASPWMLLAAWELSPFQHAEDRSSVADLHAGMLRLEMVRKIREALIGAQFHFEAINNIIASALALRERDVVAAPSAEVLTMALEAGRKAAGIFSRAIPAVELESTKVINLNHVLRDVLTLFTQRMLAQGVEVNWRPCTEAPLIQGQENALRVAFKELIENALDAMDGSWRGGRELTLATHTLTDGVGVTVADSGPGIRPQERRQVFQPFFSRKPGGCGAGMGLPLVQEVINRHGGAVDVEDGDSGGCRFRVVIPMQRR